MKIEGTSHSIYYLYEPLYMINIVDCMVVSDYLFIMMVNRHFVFQDMDHLFIIIIMYTKHHHFSLSHCNIVGLRTLYIFGLSSHNTNLKQRNMSQQEEEQK